MNKLIDALKDSTNVTVTENGAVALNSTLNSCLDAFGSLGAMMKSDEETILRTFISAFNEDRATAMKMLYYMRDIRGGQGMRRVFRIINKYLANSYPEYAINNIPNIMEYGRADDMLCLIDDDITNEEVPEAVYKFIKTTLINDITAITTNIGNVSLLAKWLPSENTSSITTRNYARKIIKYLNVTPKDYRQMLSKIRAYLKVVEVDMSANKWDNIDYERVPSKANIKYSDAFYNHATERYTKYLKDVAMGNAKINSGTLFPVDIISKCWEHIWRCSPKDRVFYDTMWKALPNYFEGKKETGICVCDTSGSMNGLPINVALSLGIYCADKCRGPFKNHFITFDYKPTLQEIKGEDIIEKVSSIRSINVANTDLEKVFDLILNTAIENNLAQEDMPSKLYIISDMQFDEASGSINYYGKKINRTFMNSMKLKYTDAGYKMPAIVYWNVRASECGMFQQKFDGEDCAMVSGYSASLFKAVIEGTTYEEETVIDEDGNEQTIVKEKIDPMAVMLSTLNNERYDKVYTGA